MTDEEKYVEIIVETKKWHDRKISQLEKFRNLTDDQKIFFQDDKGAQTELSAEHRKGFIIGILTALEIIGEYPVKIEQTEED
jgi:hypothetical protein